MIFSEPKPAGDFRIVANVATTPTAWEHSSGVTLVSDAAARAAGA
jgi:hypothetical protein